MHKELIDGVLVDVLGPGDPGFVSPDVTDSPAVVTPVDPAPISVTNKDNVKLVDSVGPDEVKVEEAKTVEERVKTYIHGTDFSLTQAELDEYKKLNAELTSLLEGKTLGDIPLSDPYYSKKAELDVFVSRLHK